MAVVFFHRIFQAHPANESLRCFSCKGSTASQRHSRNNIAATTLPQQRHSRNNVIPAKETVS
jgi:hypothetical protein